ncbi:MAG: hypothetical protein IBX70_13480 [Clostridia bacterium]|nr:hypothetical protein [Clostridia bacterium]
MEKIIVIGGKSVLFKSTGAYLYKYKAQFNKDAFQDIMKLKDLYDEETKQLANIETLDLELFYNLVWVLAKTADPAINPPEEWLDEFDEFPLFDIIPEVIDMILSTITSTAKKK